MKTSTVSKRAFLATSVTALCGAVSFRTLAQEPDKKFRVGTYDSRAIAIAFANSEFWRKTMDNVRADHRTAQEAKDDKRAKAIEARMKSAQHHMHEQGFSTASVTNLLASVKDEIPGVAKAAGVDLIVSKWEIMVPSPDVVTVDLTGQLVSLFNPSPKALKWIESIGTKPPIPIEELPDDDKY